DHPAHPGQRADIACVRLEVATGAVHQQQCGPAAGLQHPSAPPPDIDETQGMRDLVEVGPHAHAGSAHPLRAASSSATSMIMSSCPPTTPRLPSSIRMSACGTP